MSDGPDLRRDARHDQPAPTAPIEHLWAPWRAGYIADGDPLDGCPFCVLPDRGPERDRESLILHRGSGAYVIFNAYPYNPGHVMVVPYAHVDDVALLDDDTSAELWELARSSVQALRDALGAEGANLGMNLGRAAGAGIADHLHLHVVPRWGGDTNFMTTTAGARVLPKALDDLWSTVAAAFRT